MRTRRSCWSRRAARRWPHGCPCAVPPASRPDRYRGLPGLIDQVVKLVLAGPSSHTYDAAVVLLAVRATHSGARGTHACVQAQKCTPPSAGLSCMHSSCSVHPIRLCQAATSKLIRMRRSRWVSLNAPTHTLLALQMSPSPTCYGCCSSPCISIPYSYCCPASSIVWHDYSPTR